MSAEKRRLDEAREQNIPWKKCGDGDYGWMRISFREDGRIAVMGVQIRRIARYNVSDARQSMSWVTIIWSMVREIYL